MPKIAIDISPLNNGNKFRGVGYYTKNLIEALSQEHTEFKFNLIENPQENTSKYDLIHYPYFTPFQLTLPLIKKKPTIISIHDAIERQYKEHYPVGVKGEIKWLIQRYLARQADFIITISHYSKYQISEVFNFPADKIFVTPLAASDNFKIITKPKNKYNLPQKFILYVGDINWNKNIPTLVKSCLALNYPLVIVGSSATKKVPQNAWTNDVCWLQSLNSPLLHLLGFVPDEDMPDIYNLATIYCQPSYAEGFGLTVVEALRCGVPVIYPQQTAVAEIIDYNGLMFDPYNQKTLEAALTKLWNSQKLRKKYSKLGLKHSQIYSWKKTAKETIAVYKLALLNAK